MSNEAEDFEAMSERILQQVRTEQDQDDAELREKYLAFEPHDREAFKRIVTSLSEVNDLLPRARFFNAMVQLAIGSFQASKPQCWFVIPGLSA